MGDVGVTYTSSSPVTTTSGIFGYNTLPVSFNVPNVNPTIQNIDATTNTITFDRPVADPLLVFASVGTPGTAVPVVFDRPIALEFDASVSNITPTSFVGNEGYAIVRVPGVHTELTFDYTVAEFYVNFVFGFGGTDADTDGDGTPDVCDVCPDDASC